MLWSTNNVALKSFKIAIFQFWHFSPIFVLLQLGLLVTLFEGSFNFSKLVKLTNFGIFYDFVQRREWSPRFARQPQ